MIRYRIFLGRIYKRSGWRSVTSTNCRFYVFEEGFSSSISEDFKYCKSTDQLIRPCVTRWFMRYLFFISGMKITFVLLLPTCFKVSRYRICIAALVLSSSAASLISLADYTSALAEMILLSANLLSLAALDSDSWSSLLSWMSFMNISSIWVIWSLHRRPTPQRNDRLVSRYHQRSPASSRASLVVRIAHRYFWGSHRLLLQWLHWNFEPCNKHIWNWRLCSRLRHRCWWRRCLWWWCSGWWWEYLSG